MGEVVRILVADDHPLTRDGIKAALALDAELEVVAEARDGQEAVSLAEAVKPDVVLMDVRMPVLGGIRATQAISRTVPNARVVMLTVEETQARVGEAIQAGAAGYLLKDIGRPRAGQGRAPGRRGLGGHPPQPDPPVHRGDPPADQG
jgi:DNA-binding NarL/FixJ family response regulator